MSKMARSVFEGEDGEPTLDIYTLNLYVRKCGLRSWPYEREPFTGQKVGQSDLLS